MGPPTLALEWPPSGCSPILEYHIPDSDLSIHDVESLGFHWSTTTGPFDMPVGMVRITNNISFSFTTQYILAS